MSLCICLSIQGEGDSSENPLKINAIYPSGEDVDSEARITIEFTQVMVDMSPSVYADKVVPIEVDPALDCDWIWIESNVLRCDLQEDEDLFDATMFTVTVRSEITSLLGHELEEEYLHTFETALPNIRNTNLISWISPTRPIIDVSFDQEVKLQSVQDRIHLIDSRTLQEYSVRVWPYSRKVRYALSDDKYGQKQTFQKFNHLNEQSNTSVNTDHVLLFPDKPLPVGITLSVLLLPGIEGAHGNVRSRKRHTVDAEVSTIGKFQLLGLICQDVHGKSVVVTPSQSGNVACDASADFAVLLSSPLKREIQELVQTDPHTQEVKSDEWPGSFRRVDWYSDGELSGFKYSFRNDFKPSTEYQLYVGETRRTINKTHPDPRVRDGFDRPLISTNKISFRTAHSSPRVLLEDSWMVIDSNSSFDPLLYTRNVEDIIVTYDLFDLEGEQRNLTLTKPSPKYDDIFESQNLGFRSALRLSSGAMFGSISGRPRFDRPEESVTDYFQVLATPYSIFVKVRDFKALVWVVDLRTGEPVSNAEVKLFQGDIDDYFDTLESFASGVTDTNGLITFQTRQSTNPEWLFSKRYSIRVEGKKGIAMMPVIDDFEYQEQYFSDPRDINIEAWITTLQPLYEPGDTVHIKGYIRDISANKLEIPDGMDFALCIRGGDLHDHRDITLNQFGAFHLSYDLHESTEFGEFDIRLVFSHKRPINDSCSYLYDEKNYDTPGVHVADGSSFEVYEFETSPLQVSLDLNSKIFRRGDRMSIHTSSEFYDGRPNSHGVGSMDVVLIPGPPPIKTVDITEYEFSGIPLVPLDSDWFQKRTDFDIVLDDEGKHTLTFSSLGAPFYFATFRIEGWVSSSNGDVVTKRTMADYYGVDQFVGIRHPVASPEISYQEWKNTEIKVDSAWPVEVLVVSKDDELVAGKKVQITVYSRGQELSYSTYEWRQVFKCEVVSALTPISCDFIPTEIGHYRIDAQIVDSKGHSHQSSVLVEAVGLTAWTSLLSERPKLDDLKLLCEAQEVKVGDTVRCTVENSMSNAPTLVTIEHNGVIDQWLVRLDPTNPIIEFDIREEYVPNFTLSVLNQKPLDSPNDLDTAIARIGNAEFIVEHPYYKPLEIAISTNKKSYDVGDQVMLSISAENVSGVVPIEYTVAVLDETLLDFVSELEDEHNFVDFPVLHELLPPEKDTANRYFDPTKKLWHSVDSGVHTLGLLVAFRDQSVAPDTTPETRDQSHFVNTWRPLSRYPRIRWSPTDMSDPTLQETKNWVAYWNPSLVTPSGQAKLSFDLPKDSTSWKVMVTAASRDHRFGYATTSFTSKRDITNHDVQTKVIVRTVQPNVVTEGDTFQVGTLIENPTERRRRFTVDLKASGSLVSDSETQIRQHVDVAPFETKILTMDVKAEAVPLGMSQLNDPSEIRVVASVRGRRNNEELDMRIPVRSNRIRISNVAYGTLKDTETNVPILFPSDSSIKDRKIDLTLTSNDRVNLNGVFRTVTKEPYLLWEQRLSQAILAMQYIQLEEREVKHENLSVEPDQLVAQTLASISKFQKPSGGMVYSQSPENSSVSPYLSAYTALVLGWLSDANYDIPETTSQKLTAYIHDFLENENGDTWSHLADEDEDLRHRLQATTSAVMFHALALAEDLTETDLDKYSDRIDHMDVFGMSHYLLATLELNSSHPLNDKVMKRIMHHLSADDGTVTILESLPSTFTQIHHSKTRTLCSVLEALTKFSKSKSNSIDIGILKELANSVRFVRQGSFHWANTQENVFCTNALITYFDHVDSQASNLQATVDLYMEENQKSIRLVDGWQMNQEFTQLHTAHLLQDQRLTPTSVLKINRQGTGTAFYDVELSYQAILNQEINRYSGLEIHREYVVFREEGWEILEPGDHVKKGDTVLVNLFLNNKFNRFHVVLEDPVPGGLEPVSFEEFGWYPESYFNSTSEFEDVLPTSKWYEEFKKDALRGWNGELGLQTVQFFEEYLLRNKYHAAWIGRAITSGEFRVLPAHVEEVYRPVMFSKSKPWILKVEP